MKPDGLDYILEDWKKILSLPLGWTEPPEKGQRFEVNIFINSDPSGTQKLYDLGQRNLKCLSGHICVWIFFSLLGSWFEKYRQEIKAISVKKNSI